MKPAERMKRLVMKLEVDPSDEMHERTLTDIVTMHVRRLRGPSDVRTSVLRRCAGVAVAAGFVLLGLLGVLTLYESAAPAYAVEQTVAAIKKIPVVHIFGRDWDDKRIEMWVKVNPETGLMDSCQVKYLDDDRSMVSTPKNTYDRDGRTNTVRIKDGPSIASIFCLGDFFQGMERLAKTTDGRITYSEVTDPGTKRGMLELKLSAPQTEIICLIDPKTKLPINIHVTRGGRFNSCDILKHATEIRYDDTPPEGVFDFTIPDGANVSVETSEDMLQNLSVDVLRYCGQFHARSVQELAKPRNIPVNTRLYLVDSEFRLRDGGFVEIYNDSNEVWKGEIGAFNLDPPQVALFDAASGKKQQIRLVQHRQSPPGRFRVYWRFDEPLPPGQTRYGIYWTGERKMPGGSAGEHLLNMNNRFGAEGIENFMLIVPKGLDVSNSSRPYDSSEEVGDCRVYAWQRHLPPEMIVNQVDVTLSQASADYSDDYIRDNTGKVLIEIPEVFELANIAIAISEIGLQDPYKVNKSGAYYQRVLEHFLPFKDHPLITQPSLHYNHGYMFRDNSVCYAFEGHRIVPTGPYRDIREPDLFGEQLALVQDFAKVSGFRQFYRDNLPFYRQQIDLYRRNAPLQKMWTWLEERFPARHNCYKVVFSPLLGGSHETCNFKRKGFSETIMFVSGPGEAPHEIEDGFLSQAVFTEIDHNYVNSITAGFIEQVNKAFADLNRWGPDSGYESPEMMFNEYMTWGVFILYAYDTYDAKYFEMVKEHVIRQMIDGRKFVRFREFTEELLRLYRSRTSGQSIPDLYPAILAWARDDSRNAYDANVPHHAGETATQAKPPKLPYEGVDGLVEFVHRARQTIAVDRIYQTETKEEFVLAKDEAARLTLKDNPAGVAEFLFVYDGNAVHVIYRCRGDTERQYNSTWLDLNRREDSRGIYATGAKTYLKCVSTWEPKDGQATVRFHTEKPSEQEQEKFLKDLRAQEEYKKYMQAVREQAIAVREWDATEKVEPYTITMDDPNDPNMVELRTKYGLEDLVRGAADDYEKLKRITAWVQKQWEHNGNNSPSKSDPLTILKEVSEGKRFRCVEYAIVVTGCTRSLGMSSRTLGLMRPDVETAESGAGHVVAEVWLSQFGKWVMVDGQWGAIAESKGAPLNAVELQDAIARKDPGLTIQFLSQITTADRQAEYIEWIIPYLYYLNFGCDQRFYRSAAQGQPAQRGQIILIPKGANEPKAFQRHPSFQGAAYISNPKAFYPPMDKAVTTQPYEFNTSIKATLEENSEIRLDCPANPYGVNLYTIYYHVDKGGIGYVGIRAALANGRYSQCEVAAANCDCILQQPSSTPCLGILTWQLHDGRLDVGFCTSSDKDKNYRTRRQYAADGKRVSEQYVNRRLVLPDSVSRREAIEDVDYLVAQLKAKHPKPFAKTSEKDFNEELERLKAAMPEQVPIADLSLSVAVLLALVGDDHTVHRDFSVFDEYVANGGKVFPVKLRYKDDRMVIVAWSPEVSPSRMKAGDIVVAVNDQTLESLLHRYGRYMSLETDLQKWWTLEWAIEKYQVLLGDARDRYTLQMQDSEGRTYSETLPAVKPWLAQYEKSGPQAPRFHYQFYEDGKVCLFKLQTFNWDLRAELEAKANALVEEMRQNGTKIAILDLRGNGGGNSNMGYMVFAKMVDKPYGELRPDSKHSWPVKLALLCDRSTYSAASFEAMFFKDYKMGIIAGEETGGRASSFGDIEHVRLPNSFLTCGIATGYFPRRAGYDDGRGVLPDLPLDVAVDDGVLVGEICAYIRSREAAADKPL